jgi:hypothetical protein
MWHGVAQENAKKTTNAPLREFFQKSAPKNK